MLCRCFKVLIALSTQPGALYFLEPMDPGKYVSYYETVAEPLAFSQLARRLRSAARGEADVIDVTLTLTSTLAVVLVVVSACKLTLTTISTFALAFVVALELTLTLTLTLALVMPSS